MLSVLCATAYLDLQADGIQGHWMSPQALCYWADKVLARRSAYIEDGQREKNKTNCWLGRDKSDRRVGERKKTKALIDKVMLLIYICTLRYKIFVHYVHPKVIYNSIYIYIYI